MWMCALCHSFCLFLLICFDNWQFSNWFLDRYLLNFSVKNIKRNRRPKNRSFQTWIRIRRSFTHFAAFHSVRSCERVYANLCAFFCSDSNLSRLHNTSYIWELNSIDFQSIERFCPHQIDLLMFELLIFWIHQAECVCVHLWHNFTSFSLRWNFDSESQFKWNNFQTFFLCVAFEVEM